MTKAIVIHSNRHFEVTDLHDVDDYQDVVGGFFEILSLQIDHPDWDSDKPRLNLSMYINDAGQIGMVDVQDVNKVASTLAYMGGVFQIILGDVALVGGPIDGDDTDVPDKEIKRWIKRINKIQMEESPTDVHTS